MLRIAAKNKAAPTGRPYFIYMIRCLLEAVADTQGEVTPVEVRFRKDIEARTNVKRQLDRYSLEFVLHTNLGNKGESDVAVIDSVIVPVTQVGTNTAKPAKAAANLTSPLVDTRQADSRPTVITMPSEVQLEAVAAQTMQVGELSVVTLTATQTDTEGVILCISRHGHRKNCYECNKKFLHVLNNFGVNK